MTGAFQSAAAWQWWVLGMLAVWRATHFLNVEHGPWGAAERLRAAAPRLGLGEALACFYCLSLWIAAPAALVLAESWPARAVGWLALSAGAVLIEIRLVGATPPEE